MGRDVAVEWLFTRILRHLVFTSDDSKIRSILNLEASSKPCVRKGVGKFLGTARYVKRNVLKRSVCMAKYRNGDSCNHNCFIRSYSLPLSSFHVWNKAEAGKRI